MAESIQPAVVSGLAPYDLTAPARLLYPGMPQHARTGLRDRAVSLGSEAEPATLRVVTWDDCSRYCPAEGPHEAGNWAQLIVPCDARPHCQACECDEAHRWFLTDEQVAVLKGILP